MAPRFPLFALILLGLAAVASAHPLKLSVTEATYNAESGRLELAIRFFADDFEEALSKDAGRRVPVDRPEALAPAADAYLRKHFLVRSADGQAQTLIWSGSEVTTTHVWLYCEAPLPGGTIGAELNVTFMQELFPDMLNSVQLKDGTMKQTLIFVRSTGPVTIRAKR